MTIVDKHPSKRGARARVEQRVARWTIVLPMVATVAAIVLAAAGIAVPSAFVLSETAFLYMLTVLGVTVGFHRQLTHRSFAAPDAVRAALAAIGCMAAQGPPAFWVSLHRMHHRYSDQPRDPHSPHSSHHADAASASAITGSLRTDRQSGKLRGLWHAHVSWMMERVPSDWPSYVGDLLRDRTIGKVGAAYGWWVLAGIAAPALAAGLVHHSLVQAGLGALWGGLLRIFLVHHATWSVNSICHVFGRRSFDTSDDSRNNALVALLTAGEGWHNNHHAFPTSARHGLRWWQLDMSYAVIRGMARLGLASRIVTCSPERMTDRSLS